MVNRGMTSGGRAPRGNRRDEQRLLSAVPSLTEAPASLLAAMVDTGYVVQVQPDWPLLIERTAPERAYVLLDGTVDVRRAGAQLGQCRPGEILGELGIVHRRLRTATVMTTAPTTVLHLSRDAFEALHAQEAYFRALVGEAMLRKSA